MTQMQLVIGLIVALILVIGIAVTLLVVVPRIKKWLKAHYANDRRKAWIGETDVVANGNGEVVPLVGYNKAGEEIKLYYLMNHEGAGMTGNVVWYQGELSADGKSQTYDYWVGKTKLQAVCYPGYPNLYDGGKRLIMVAAGRSIAYGLLGVRPVEYSENIVNSHYISRTVIDAFNATHGEMNKKFPTWVLVAAGIMLIALIGVGVYFGMRGNGSGAKPLSPTPGRAGSPTPTATPGMKPLDYQYFNWSVK